jgi:hypothetical protein
MDIDLTQLPIADGTDHAPISVTMDLTAMAASDRIRAFLWNDINTMSPLTGSIAL